MCLEIGFPGETYFLTISSDDESCFTLFTVERLKQQEQ